MIDNMKFRKRDIQLYTYKSGGRQFQIDMVIVRKSEWKYLNDAKIIPSETVATPHKPLVVTFDVTRWKRKDLRSTEIKIQYSKLRGANSGVDSLRRVGGTK